MKKHFTSFLLFCIFFTSSSAQVSITNNSMTVAQYVQTVLIGNGVSVSNIQFNGGSANVNNEQIGSFLDNNSAATGLSSGLILGSGDVQLAGQNNSSGGASLGGSGNMGSDSDLQSITVNQIYDECVIEFDFIPEGDTIAFNYVFASEEYEEYVCGSVNDAFGFFLTGINPTGANYNAKNIALIPNPSNPSTYTNTPVSINTVNPGVPGLFGFSSTCSAIDPNWASYNVFYTNNTTGNIEYDGKTVVLTAQAVVSCGTSYHIKLAIGDGGDSSYDSGVFLEEGSFSSNNIGVSSGIADGDTILYEGCNAAFFNFERDDASTEFIVYFELGGTATPGLDYPMINDSLVIPIGQFSDTIFIYPTLDSINEPSETVILNVIFERCFGQMDTSTAVLYISDYTPLSLSMLDSINICSSNNEYADLVADWDGGIDPIDIQWTNGSSNVSEISVSPDLTSYFGVSIYDGCNKEIHDSCIVWNQCPIEPINVFTPNNDGQNDYFIPVNLEQYPSPYLVVLNRWGRIVYETSNYQYDWSGTHYKSGEPLPDGVYYYQLNPNSNKYEYGSSNKEELNTTIAGSVQIIKN
ncbi:MAG: choice-of-anchor L domain-containing protein [Flavobacteriales bacterium]|nr:choice-of-anchor L domain-containing protein [Flavobacteriales bacterium]